MSLLEAAASGNATKVEEIIRIKKEKCKDIRDNHRFVPQSLKKVTKSKFPFSPFFFSFTALHHAVSSKNIECVKVILKNLEYFDIKAQSFEGWTALYLGICRPDCIPLEIIRILLEAEPSLHGIKDTEDVSPLHQAVEKGKEDVVEVS